MASFKSSAKSSDSLLPAEASDDLTRKAMEFYEAMETYSSNPGYARIERLTSVMTVSFQLLSLWYLVQSYTPGSLLMIMFAVAIAYLLADFINGLVHMYMDNNTAYTSMAGPFIASFHLHHARPKYRERHPVLLYFFESGTKFWLVIYLILLLLAQNHDLLPFGLNVCLVSVGILSSIAELSHYWCHNATKENRVILALQKYRLLLSRQHHRPHHVADNTHYAFLNGLTDPLLNVISKHCFKGYKNHADKHTAAYLRAKNSK